MATIIQTEKDGDKMYGPPIIGSVCVCGLKKRLSVDIVTFAAIRLVHFGLNTRMRHNGQNTVKTLISWSYNLRFSSIASSVEPPIEYRFHHSFFSLSLQIIDLASLIHQIDYMSKRFACHGPFRKAQSMYKKVSCSFVYLRRWVGWLVDFAYLDFPYQ